MLGLRTAHAGSYNVTYSASGPATWRSDDQTGTSAYAPGPNGFGGAAGCAWIVKTDADGNRVSTTGECHADSIITAHFVWNSSEPPPKNVIIYEQARAYYLDGGSNSGGTGGCTVPLDHITSGPIMYPTGPFTPPIALGQSKTGYKYWVKQDPGNGFDVSCAVTAYAGGMGQVGPPVIYSGAMASALYSAQASPVELTLNGTTKVDGADNILIGQKCTGIISCGLAILTNHQWTIPGVIYGGFSVNYDPLGVIGAGGPVDLPADLLTQSSPSWYWKEDGNFTVACSASAVVDGQNIGQVTAEKDVSVQAPTSDLRYYFGQIQLTREGLLGLFGVPAYNPGLRARAWAKTPDLFTGLMGTGSIQFTQMALTDSSWTDNNNVTHYFNGGLLFGLDAGLSNDWALYGRYHTADGSWDEGGYLEIEDSPTTVLSKFPDIRSLERTFFASTWVMYIPPGLESAWVPLWRFNWGMNYSAYGPLVTNGDFSSWFPSVSGQVTPSPVKNWLPDFPAWFAALDPFVGYNPP